jgi:hypothetical protein
MIPPVACCPPFPTVIKNNGCKQEMTVTLQQTAAQPVAHCTDLEFVKRFKQKSHQISLNFF